MNKITIAILLPVFLLFTPSWIKAQDKPVAEEIIAVVGSQIILKSDVERQLAELHLSDSASISENKCSIFKNVLVEKLLLNQAYLDSIKVTDEQVNSEIGKRLNYFISMAGSTENLEKYYHKTVAEIKNSMKEPIKELLMVRGMKEKIIGKQQVSPIDIREYFNHLPPDSLPFYNTEVEVAQIVVYPKATPEEDQKARVKISELRDRIMKGEKFENLAILYSEDDVSATKGGDLGMRSRMEFVPEFGYAAIKLKNDSISDIVKTKYGYHIIKMIERKGEQIHVRHILIKPQITSESRNKAIEYLSQIYKRIKSDSMGFSDAAYKYSEDENTKNNGGMITDPENGSTKLSLDKLDAGLFFLIDSIKVGHLTAPVKFITQDGRTAYRIVLLKSKTLPHKSNLTDDYARIQEMATNYNNLQILEKWFKKTIGVTYIQIKEPYNNCQNLKAYQGLLKK